MLPYGPLSLNEDCPFARQSVGEPTNTLVAPRAPLTSDNVPLSLVREGAVKRWLGAGVEAYEETAAAAVFKLGKKLPGRSL